MERRDGRALRPREAAQAVAVEPEVHQDTDIGSAVLVVALLGYEPPERRAGHVGVKLPPIQSMLGGVRGPVCTLARPLCLTELRFGLVFATYGRR